MKKKFIKTPLVGVQVHGAKDVGTRTVNLLMGEHAGEYVRGDILDANATAILIKNLHNPDIEKLKEQIEEARRKLANAVMNESIGIPGGVASLDDNGNIPTSQLGNVDIDIFMIVNELPTENIKNNKIYCIKDTSSTAQDNGYIEYAYINNKWEKIGEFQAEPNLSGYAKLNGCNFTGNISFDNKAGLLYAPLRACWVEKHNGAYLTCKGYNRTPNIAFTTDGELADIGAPENFTFTLEDGSTVTKSIRVISTTSQAGA